MKRYFIYAIVLGFLGNALLDSGIKSVSVNNTASQLAQLGE